MTATLPTMHEHRTGDLLRAAGSTVTLVTFIAGVPITLIALAPTYLPDTLPTWGQVPTLLVSPDDGSLLFAVLGLVAWCAWGAFTLSTIVEIGAGLRDAQAPHLPLLGGLQHTAARLLASAGILLALATTNVAHAPAAHATTATIADRPTLSPALAMAGPATTASHFESPAVTEPAPAPVLPVVTVKRGDTLWSLAEQHLGAGVRYTEIRDLNAGRTQPDGRTLRDADWILPGWQLLLPVDATLESAPHQAAVAAQATAADTVTVQPGDTLWDIAAQHLGDGHLYTELVDLNRDRPQPGGQALHDPNVIEPGWVLQLPTTTSPLTPAPPSAVTATTREAPAPLTSILQTSPIPPLDDTAHDDEPRIPAPAQAPLQNTVAEPLATITGTSDDSIPRPVWFAGLTALAAAGVAGELTRRRHLQQRARRLGQHIPLPDRASSAAQTEATLRGAAPPMSIAMITSALANLSCRCFDAERELPDLAALLIDQTTLTLLLTDDDPDPVAPFTATNPTTWTAETSDLADDPTIDDADRCDPYPLLVTAGHTSTGTLVINLEAAGTLSITGNDDIADDILRALVVECATSDLSGQLCVCLTDDDSLAALAPAFEAHRLRVITTPAERSITTDSIGRCLAEQGLDDTLQARGDRQAPDTWLPTTFVERAVTGELGVPWTGTALITRESNEGAWTIRANDDGTAALNPLQITFQPQRLSTDHLADLHTLLAVSIPPTNLAQEPATTAADDIATLRNAHGSATRSDPTRAHVMIRVLGPIEIDGLPPGIGTLSPRMTELLVYLALHGPATGADLDDTLWNGARISAGTRNALVYRTRRHVGVDVLPLLAEDGLYRLGPGATTDWREFQHLLGNEHAEPELLGEALDLVRDRPFRGISGAEYAWADYDIQQMTSAIADAATVLARIQHDAGRDREALSTAMRGLRVAAFSDALQDLALTATGSGAGDADAALLRSRFNLLLGELDPGIYISGNEL
ncbi:LysM peptidoglycan-binding domain-containing protein [Cellulomonas sp. McL0617]|uniref:LysM peptidoglycan-binding domain-containing protein n=1 Tax=Cellulomonas sp. McL0617 TaxID=3415675 RepID=UPI003CECFA9D